MLISYQSDGHAFELGPGYADADMVDPGRGEAQPRGQFEEVGEDRLVQLQVAQLALATECAQIYLVRGEVLCVSIGEGVGGNGRNETIN